MKTADISKLLEDLDIRGPQGRRRAIEALAASGAKEAVAAIVNHLDDGDPEVEQAAGRALMSLRGREVVSRLAPLLAVEQVGLRNLARELLRRMGQDAPDLILELLDDIDSDLRIFGAEILENVDTPQSRRVLLEALEDPDPNVRAAVAVSLGRRKDAAAVPYLVQHIHDDEWVGYAVVEALAEIGDRSALEPLLEALGRVGDLIRMRIAETLGRFADPQSVGPLTEAIRAAEGPLLYNLAGALMKSLDAQALQELEPELFDKVAQGLIEALKEPLPQMKADALMGLAVMADPGAVDAILGLAAREQSPEQDELICKALVAIGEIPPLLAAISGPEPRLVQVAGEALGRIGGVQACQALVGCLGHEDPLVRCMAARTLGASRWGGAIKPVIAALKDPDNRVRLEAARALGPLGGNSAVEPLSRLLGSGERELAAQAQEALLTIGTNRVHQIFWQGLSSQAAGERLLCVKGLGELGPGDALGDLAALMLDSDPQVRREAVTVALSARDWHRLPHLEEVLGDPVPQVRLTLISAVCDFRDPRAERLLVKALGDEDMDVRLRAVEGLGRSQSLDGVAPLVKLLASGDFTVRARAARALGEIGDSGTADDLIALLSDEHPQVRAAAVSAIQQIEGGWM